MIAPTSRDLPYIFTELYPLEHPQAARSTLGQMRGHVARWVSLTANCPVDLIDRPTLLGFRKSVLDLGFAASTVNSHISTVTGLARLAGNTAVWKNLKLAEQDDPLPTPKIEQLDRAWQMTGHAQWPLNRKINGRPIWCRIPATLWWRAVLLLAFTTGLRRADLFGLTWDQIEADRIPTVNRKTKKRQYLPIAPPLRPWLELLKRNGTPRVLGPKDRATHQIDRELQRIADAAGIAALNPQSLRRAAARAYEKAHPGCGKLILNHGKSVTERHYLDTEETLRDAQPKLIYPPSFLERPSLERQGLLF